MGKVVYLTPAFTIDEADLALLTRVIRETLGA